MKTGTKIRPGLWLSTLVSIVGLILVVLFSYIIEKAWINNMNPVLLTIVSLFIAFLPPLIWLTVFYRQDRLEPEPKSFVFKTLILGALVQKALYAPIMAIVMPSEQASRRNAISDYVFTIILIALIQEATKLLTVRYSIYPSKEFDERIDGIIYGSALGLGFAAMTNLDFIISNQGVMLSAVSSTVVIESLAHASFTGLSCYFLGIAKFSKFSFLRMPAAILIAASLNAVSRIIVDNVIRNGFKVNYFLGIIPAALIAVVVFGLLVFIASRSKGAEERAEQPKAKDEFLAVLPVWILLVAALITGFAIKNMPEKTAAYSVENGINVSYPAAWAQQKQSVDVFRAGDMLSGSGNNYVSVKKVPISGLISYSGTPTLDDVGAAWSIKLAREYLYYYSEKSYILSFDDKEAYVLEYVSVSKNTSSLIKSTKPEISYTRDFVFVDGDSAYIITVSTEYEDWINKKDNFDRIKLSINQ